MEDLSRRFAISKKDILPAAILLLLAAFLFFYFSLQPEGAVAVVEKNGEEILRRQLSQLTQPETVSVEGEEGLQLSVCFYPDGAQILSSACPDQVCVKTGKITKSGETAVCLPARITLRLEGAQGADAQTY